MYQKNVSVEMAVVDRRAVVYSRDLRPTSLTCLSCPTLPWASIQRRCSRSNALSTKLWNQRRHLLCECLAECLPKVELHGGQDETLNCHVVHTESYLVQAFGPELRHFPTASRCGKSLSASRRRAQLLRHRQNGPSTITRLWKHQPRRYHGHYCSSDSGLL